MDKVVGIERHSTYEGVDWATYSHTQIERLRQKSKPIPGRDGWRIDENGKEWYSTAWLGLTE